MGLCLFPQSLKPIASTMVRFSSHWRGLLQVSQGYLWSPLLSLPSWGLCSLLLCLLPQHHCPLVLLQSKVRAQECWRLWRIHHAQLVTAEREGSGTLTLLTPCALFSLPADQEENSLCRTSGKSHRQGDLPNSHTVRDHFGAQIRNLIQAFTHLV